MTILTLQFGQCGNQIGHSLFTYLANDIKTPCPNLPKSVNIDYAEASTAQWFNENLSTQECYVPRSILVDTENKVISSLMRDKKLLKYRNVVARSEGGSANNWAYGYKEKGEGIKDEVVEYVRREVERSDEIIKVLSVLSSGGGTGSGAGSRIIEAVRDAFPNKEIVNIIILPYNDGEVVTQSYNTLLTLEKLHDITDGCVLFENDKLHKLCKDLLAIKQIGLEDINSVIVQNISSVLQPVKECSLSSFVSQLTSHPSYKFVEIKTTPHIPPEYMKYESVQGWPMLIGHLRNMLRVNSQHWETKRPQSSHAYTHPTVQFTKSTGSLLISRGGLSPEPKMLEPLAANELHARWLPNVDRLRHYHQPRKLYNTINFLSLATNNNAVCQTLDKVIEQAWMLFNHKAYVHQYEKYGVNADEFNNAFEKLECVMNSYQTL